MIITDRDKDSIFLQVIDRKTGLAIPGIKIFNTKTKTAIIYSIEIINGSFMIKRENNGDAILEHVKLFNVDIINTKTNIKL